ncbi:MAG: acyl carrier protein [Bacteroidales bacterium]|nr:acyl carrier protein [Bacteroidales bacterium]
MKEKFIEALAEALEMEPADIKMEDKFRDYDAYDSLTELSVFAMLDSEFGIELEMEEYKKYFTVKDLFQLVQNRTKN